ncbi:MAG: hypothetical protein DBX90_00930 [Lentisphaerae bacterium]|nr:MAG: hypothetical protein DBX90_00930 [Lentisphaerota bacterium]
MVSRRRFSVVFPLFEFYSAQTASIRTHSARRRLRRSPTRKPGAGHQWRKTDHLHIQDRMSAFPSGQPARSPNFFKKIRKNVKKEASDRFKKQGDGLYYETIIAEPK